MRLINFASLMIIAVAISFLSCNSDAAGEAAAPGGGTGQSGSMARFAIKNDILYVLGTSTLHVYNIEADTFRLVRNVDITGETFGTAETIFVNGDFLYLGATDAMYIYSIANTQNPKFAFRYEHIVSCDPVVVQGNRAYVTLRSGTACNRGQNLLDILDITDPYNPSLVNSYPMISPHGLGVLGDLLFVCEGNAGFKVLDVSNDFNVQEVHRETGLHTYDVILKQDHAIFTGEDGVYQYSFSPTGEEVELESVIPVNPNF